MRVLFVKLTSMGDLLHALPALTDAKKHYPAISFDWVIEKSFSEIARFHPAVKNIIPTEHRKWRRNIVASFQNGEIKNFITTLRQNSYDLVIDGQSSLKSAITTFLAKGLRVGLDKYSASERIASLFYRKKIFVDKDMHAIKRLRVLFSEVFQYPYQNTPPDFGIAEKQFPLPFALPKDYLVFVHNASWQSKLWPEVYWRKLIIMAAKRGLHVLLPWGNPLEKKRAERIQENNSNAIVLPFLTLSEHAAILQNAKGAICSDTGLSHLAAALNVPAITLYGSTSKKLIGTTGSNQAHYVSPFSCIECYKFHCQYNHEKHADALCAIAIKPEIVWENFSALLG